MKESTRQALLVTVAILCALFMSGIVYGWDSLKFILIQSGVYADDCSSSDSSSSSDICSKRDNHLNIMYTVGSSLVSACSLTNGFILDKFGPRYTVIIGCVMFALGCVGMAISSLFAVDLYIFSFAVIAVGGPCAFLAFLALAGLFPAKYRNLFSSVVCCCFDMSSAVFLLFKLVFVSAPVGTIQLGSMFLVYLLVPALGALAALALIPRHLVSDDKSDISSESDNHDIQTLKNNSSDHLLAMKGERENAESLVTTPNQLQSCPKLENLSLLHQTLSAEFWLVVVFMSLHMLRANFYFGSVSDQLEWVADADNSHSSLNSYRTVFGILMFCFPPVVAILTTMILNKSYKMGWWSVWALQIVFTIVSSIKILPLQYATFCAVLIMRSMMYMVMAQFVGNCFGFKRFGTVYGLMMFLNGGFGFIQILLKYLVLEALEGDFLVLNIALGVITTALGLLLPIYLTVKRF